MARSPRNLLVWAGACMALFVAVMALAYFLPAARHADSAAARDFALHAHRGPVAAVASFFVALCDWIEYLVIVAALGWFVWRRRGLRVATAVGLLLAGANVSSQALKQLLAYPRDHPVVHGAAWIANTAYPSGHATAAMALAAAIVLATPRARRPLIAALGIGYTLAVSFSLLLLHWHFVSDVIGGYLLATAWSLVAIAAYRTAAVRWPERGSLRTAARAAVTRTTWRPAAGIATVVVLLGVAVVLTRIARVVSYAQTHTSFVVAVAAVAASASALLAGIAALSSRRG